MLKHLNPGSTICICGAQDGTFAKCIEETVKPNRLYLIQPLKSNITVVYRDDGSEVGTYDTEVLQILLQRFHPDFQNVGYAEFLNSIDDGHLDAVYTTFHPGIKDYIDILELARHKVKHGGYILGVCHNDYTKIIEAWSTGYNMTLERFENGRYSIRNIKNSIHVVSLSNREALYSKTFANHRAYYDLHRIKYTQFTQVFEESRHPSWQKIHAILKVMETAKEEYIIWLDDDVLFTNPDESFYTFIDKYGFRLNYMNCMLCEDIDTKSTIFNCGVMMFKNTEKSKEILKHIWGLGESLPITKWNLSWEQEVFNFFYKFTLPIEIHIIPHGTMQSMIRYGSKKLVDKSWKPGDFIIHISVSLELRLQYIDLLSKMLPTGLLGLS